MGNQRGVWNHDTYPKTLFWVFGRHPVGLK